MAAALGLSAAGSAFGAGFAGMSSVGAWKKCYAAGKPAPFIMIAFTGAPLTQTIYGFLLMNFINGSAANNPGLALGATGKGTANYFIVIGIVETVALFTLVFGLLLLNSAG